MSTFENINIFFRERSYINALITAAIAYIILLVNTRLMGNHKNKDINSYYAGNITVAVFLLISFVFLVIHHGMQYFKISIEPVE
jgi:uncharacterized membrane protein